MPFPTTVDTIVDAPPFGPNTLGHASQVLGPQRITVGPTQYNIKSDQYGAVGDGVTDDAAAITAAFTAAKNAGGGVVVAPGAATAYAIGSRLVVPNKVQFVGSAGRGTSVIKALGTFPINTELIRLGDVGALNVFACRAENLSIDCSGISGSKGVYSNCLNEQCGVFRVLVVNYGANGIHLDNPLVNGNCQNYTVDDVELYSGSGTGAGAIGLLISNTTLQPLRNIAKVTINASGFTQLTTAMKVDGVVPGRFSDIHIENAVTGILVGSTTICSGSTFENIYGATSGNVTTLMTWAAGQQELTAIGLVNNTNQLNDQINGVTINSGATAVSFYAIGDGAGSKVYLHNVTGQPTRVGNDLGSVGATPTLGALQTGISTQSVAGNDLHGKITLTTTAAGVTAPATIAILQFARTKAAAPVPIFLTQSGADGGKNSWYSSFQSTGQVNLATNANLLASTTYIIGYTVLGV